MIKLRLEEHDAKHLCLRGIDAMIARCLYDVPTILQLRDRPDVKPRLFPDITTDEKANAEWHEYVGPELHHLFAEAGETLVRDLTALNKDAVIFPVEHISAWMSAINQARLILGEVHHITETDMEQSTFNIEDPRHKAILQIHLLGYLLQLFVEHEQQDSV